MIEPTKLFYVHGYGFCLTIDGKRHPLNLDGDGERSDDKQLLIDTVNGLGAEVARLREHLENYGQHDYEGAGCGYYGTGPDNWQCRCGYDDAIGYQPKKAQEDQT